MFEIALILSLHSLISDTKRSVSHFQCVYMAVFRNIFVVNYLSVMLVLNFMLTLRFLD